MRWILPFLLIGGLLHPNGTVAQTLREDPATGDYILEYVDADGNAHTLVVEAMDKVDPRLTVDVEMDRGMLSYRYHLEHRATPRAQSPITSLDLPCPPKDAVAAVDAPSTWAPDAKQVQGRDLCGFYHRGDALPPGQEGSGLRIRTEFLPAIRDAMISGLVDLATWPSPEGTVPQKAYDLANEVQTYLTGAYELPSVVPGRAPAELEDPSAAVRVITDDLDRACELSWISHAGVCRSLREKLEQAGRTLGRGRVQAAREQLTSFLEELEAQHGDPPGKHVDDNAYALLGTNVRYLLSRL